MQNIIIILLYNEIIYFNLHLIKEVKLLFIVLMIGIISNEEYSIVIFKDNLIIDSYGSDNGGFYT